MKWIKIIPLLLFLPTFVYAFEYTYSLNQSRLPFTDSVKINYTGVENESMNIIMNGAFLFGNLSYIFSSSSQVIQITIDVNVPNNTAFGNYSNNVSVFKMNFSEVHKFNFNIFNATIPIVINNTNTTNITNTTNTTVNTTPVNVTPYIQTDINSFQYMICNFMLPYNFTHQGLSVRANPNENVTATFNNTIFGLNQSILMPSTGIYNFDLPINLTNMTIGKHKESISFNVRGAFSNLTFTFDIISCIRPSIDLSVLTDACKVTYNACKNANSTSICDSDYYICIANAQKAYLDSVQQSIAESQDRKVVNNTIVKYVNQTQFRDILDVTSPDVINAITSLPKVMPDIQNKLDNNYNALNSLQTKTATDISALEDRMDLKLGWLVNENNALRSNNTYYKEKYVKKASIFIVFIFLGMLGGGLVLLKLHDENNAW